MALRNKNLFNSPVALNLVKDDGKIELDVMLYNESSFELLQTQDWEEVKEHLESSNKKTVWINCYPPENRVILQGIADHFQLDAFLWADAVDFSLRSKHWASETNFFCSFKMKKPGIETTEHISFILGDEYIISLQEEKEDVFNHIRKRLSDNTGIIRQRKADYLFFLLCDALIDQYTLVADVSETQLLELEEKLNNTKNGISVSLKEVFKLKQEHLKSHRDIRTANDVIKGILDAEISVFSKMTKRLFLSISHNAQYCVDSFSRQIENTKSLSDLYFAQQNNRLNEMIKLLTIMSAVFIPLSFIAGFYGMNFENMTELKYSWTYPVVVALMLFTSIGILFYFKRKKWL